MGTDLILSISNLKYLFCIGLLALAGCSSAKKIDSNNVRENKVNIAEEVKSPHYQMGPTTVSKFFEDQTTEYGLKGVKGVHLYAVDANHDGATDLVVLEDFYSVPKFYLFDKKQKKFILSPSPFDEIVRASYLVFADFDHDGILDVVVGSLNQKSEMTQYPLRIFKGEVFENKLRYREQANPINKILPTSSVSVFDYDLDGELDLYLGNWFSFNSKNPTPVPDILLKGLGNFKFQDVSLILLGEYDYNKADKRYLRATPTFGTSICDVNQDGYPDILTSNSNGYYNKLWLNHDVNNTHEFTNSGKESGYGADQEGSEESRGGGNSFFSLCGDYNNDGIIDIVAGNLAKGSDPAWVDRSAILTGTSKKFVPEYLHSDFFYEDAKESWSEGDRRGVWIDYNLDGLTDLLIDNSGFPPDSRLTFFEQLPNHAFDDHSKKMGINILNPSGTVTLDLNGDGVMDFISGQTSLRTGENDNRIYVFVNKTDRKGKGSVRFHLQGKKSNSQGISSSVFFKTNKTKYFKNVEYSYGSLPSQNEEGVYFAFGAEKPEKVTIRWSSLVQDRLGRETPLIRQYDLSEMKLSKTHHELNLCEDGRILASNKNCY